MEKNNPNTFLQKSEVVKVFMSLSDFFYSKTYSNLFLYLYFLETVNRYNQHSMHKVSRPQIPNLLEFSFILNFIILVNSLIQL